MSYELTVDELREAVRTARIYSPSLTEEQFQGAIELQKRVGESGCLEAVQVVARLERERNISFTEVLDACEHLLRDNAELEQKAADSRATLEMVRGEVTQAQDKLHQLEEATEQAKADREREERELAAFRKKAEKEKQAIEKELERCRQEAKVTKEEVVTAGELKAEVAKHGFSLELTLGLSQEFAGCEDIRDKLAEGLKRGLTLTECNEEAAEQNERLQCDKKGLAGECQQLGSSLSQLRANEAFEKELRRFYHRYQSAGCFMEWLASWSGIYFGCCGNPTYEATKLVNRSLRGAYFWTEKRLGGTCPCCGYPRTLYDEGIYQALNLSPGDPFQLKLGE